MSSLGCKLATLGVPLDWEPENVVKQHEYPGVVNSHKMGDNPYFALPFLNDKEIMTSHPSHRIPPKIRFCCLQKMFFFILLPLNVTHQLEKS